MKHITSLFVALIAATFVHAGATLKEARQDWLEGYYGEAREAYEMLAKDPKTRLPATLGLSLALESQGEYDKALAVIEALRKEHPKDASVFARQAELLHLRGRLEEAQKTAEAAVAADENNLLARWVLGQAYRDRGELAKADAEFLFLIRVSNKRNITDPDELRILGLVGIERARHHHVIEEYQNAINNYFRKAIETDKHYWQGEYEAGKVFMDKYNKPAAFKAFAKVSAINPRSVEMLVCKGQMAIHVMEFKDAEAFAERALKINPRYVPALTLLAEVHWFSGEIDTTMKTLAKARAVNPRDEAMLARLAACHYAKKSDKEFAAIVKEAQANNPKCYTFFSDLAHLLDERKFYADAVKYFTIAIDMQPKFSEAYTGLGMHYLRMAKEEEAKKILEKAFDADKFNIRVSNSLIVLDHLARYQTMQTDHFIIRYDKKNDELLANYMAVYLENIYKELGEQFDYRPKGPFHIQIFREHQMFSGRVIALPDLHTIGACTGPLVAMVSPRDTSKFTKLFNWNRVIRHELVHVFNLEQTKSKVPHWFTEGLAVRYEGPNFPATWYSLLAEKVNNDDLLNLDNILLGFVRPRSPAQWQQAYMQSLLYVEYLTKTQGEKSIGKMLAAFAEGMDTGPALEQACGIKKEVFEKGYREFLGEKVKAIAARPPEKARSLEELRAAHAKQPDDIEIMAKLADVEFFKGKKKNAKELADKVLRKEARHPLGAYVKALILIEDGSADIAYSLLDSVVNDDLKDARPLRLLVKLQFNTKKFTQAIRSCERGRKLEPNDPTWIAQLGKLYLQTKEKEKLLEIFEEIVKIDPDEILPRKTLARHYLDMGKHKEAERFARMGLEIDVLDRECQVVILAALDGLNRMEEADRLRKMFNR